MYPFIHKNKTKTYNTLICFIFYPKNRAISFKIQRFTATFILVYRAALSGKQHARKREVRAVFSKKIKIDSEENTLTYTKKYLKILLQKIKV